MFSADSNSCDPSGAVRSNERSDAGLTNGCPRPRPVHGRGHEAEGIPGCIILAAPPFSGTSCGAAYPADPTASCTLVLLRACCLVAAEAMPVEIRTNAAASRTEGFKAARKDLGGGRAMKRTSLPLTTRVHHAARRRGGAAAAWPIAASAQQPAMPVVGFLHSGSPASYAPSVASFLQALSETGYVEGRNVTVEYRWAEDRYDRLPALAADLVQRKVAAIAAGGPPAA